MRAIVLKAFRLASAMVAVIGLAVGAFAQDADTAYVEFRVNVNATVTATQSGNSAPVSMPITANQDKTLAIPLSGVSSVWRTGGTRERLNVPTIANSRGNITLRLPAQAYQNAEIALHTVNGKRVLRGKAAASEAATAISRKNVAAGVYLLLIKGINGSAFTTRLTHSGGNLNINAVFGGEDVSLARRLAKSAAEAWTITVSAVESGYADSTYTLNLVSGTGNAKQVITLTANTTGYTVTFNANNGTGAPNAQTKTHDVPLTLSSTIPARTGYTFSGWNTQANGSGTSYSAGGNYTANAALTLYAQWIDIPTPTITTFVDNRDGKNTTYKKVTIGTQTWMAENLNYATASGSACYGEGGQVYDNETDNWITLTSSEIQANCAKYGRLYNWATAMNLPSSYNSNSAAGQIQTPHQGVCPMDWHLPSDAEWTQLTDFVGSNGSNAGVGTKLKSSLYWNSYNNVPAGTDEFGFSALPGGAGDYGGYYFYDAGDYGHWWSATEDVAPFAAWFRVMRYDGGYAIRTSSNFDKSYRFSVRCVQD